MKEASPNRIISCALMLGLGLLTALVTINSVEARISPQSLVLQILLETAGKSKASRHLARYSVKKIKRKKRKENRGRESDDEYEEVSIGKSNAPGELVRWIVGETNLWKMGVTETITSEVKNEVKSNIEKSLAWLRSINEAEYKKLPECARGLVAFSDFDGQMAFAYCNNMTLQTTVSDQIALHEEGLEMARKNAEIYGGHYCASKLEGYLELTIWPQERGLINPNCDSGATKGEINYLSLTKI